MALTRCRRHLNRYIHTGPKRLFLMIVCLASYCLFFRTEVTGPAIDKSVKDEVEVLTSLPNLPRRYARDLWLSFRSRGKRCFRYPPLFDIQFSNLYWQIFHSSNGSYYLYSAFYDNRTLVTKRPSIRILGMVNRIQPSLQVFCKIWYDNVSIPSISKIEEYNYIWRKDWGNYKQGIFQPYLMQCAVTEKYGGLLPQSVSLVEQPCEKPTNNIRVIYNKQKNEQKDDFAVCVKGLDFTFVDNSFRMTEWLELLYALGASKVFLYDLGVHPNVLKILKYYESQGRVQLQKTSLPGDQPNAPGLIHMYLQGKITHKRHNEVIHYNDCLYRNMYRYKFIILLDTDEVIVPRTTPDWKSLLQMVAPDALTGRNHSTSSYSVSNVYFLDSMMSGHDWSSSIPGFMHMMQHIYRAANHTRPNQHIKCFHDPERVLTLHNHLPLACLGGPCYHHQISTDDAHLQHYRSDCVVELRSMCRYYKTHTVRDDTIWRFKRLVVENSLHTLRHLGLLEQ